MKISRVILAFIFFFCSNHSLYAIQVEEVVTKKGLRFLFVANHDLPKVSLQVTFKAAGIAYENPEKHGLAYLTSLVMREGSGENSAEEFAKRLEEKGILLQFMPNLEDFSISLDTLSENLEEGIALISDAIIHPKVNAEGFSRSIELLKVQFNLFNKGSPYLIGMQEINKLIYKEHPYARGSCGTSCTITNSIQTLDAITNITQEDVLSYVKCNFTRDNIVISVVGSVKKEEIADLLDRYLFKLPLQKSQSIKNLPVKNDFGHGESKHIDMDISQNIIHFAQRGISYDDPNYYNAIVLINALGGGMGLNSLLMSTLRESLAMTYGIYLVMVSNKHGNIIYGSTSTNSDCATKAISVIRDTLNMVKVDGIDKQLFQDTKINLINSHIFSMFTNENIASKLGYIQANDLDIKHITHFADYINAVKLDEVNVLAKSLLDPENLFIVEVGKRSS
jgi:zinc protease